MTRCWAIFNFQDSFCVPGNKFYKPLELCLRDKHCCSKKNKINKSLLFGAVLMVVESPA